MINIIDYKYNVFYVFIINANINLRFISYCVITVQHIQFAFSRIN